MFPDHLIIDFDSTFVTVESLDELAHIVLKDNPESVQRLETIRAITRAGMEGSIPFDESLSKRLKLLNINQKDINKYFLSVLIFIISLLTISSLLTLSTLDFSESFKLSILTLMNTVNSSMYNLENLNFLNLHEFSKLVLILFMIIGRVELLTILIISKKFLFKN